MGSRGKQSPSPRNGRSYKAWHHRSTDPEDLPELSVTVEDLPELSVTVEVPPLTVSNSQYLIVSKYMFHHMKFLPQTFHLSQKFEKSILPFWQIFSLHPPMRFGMFSICNLPPQKMPKLLRSFFSFVRFGVFCCRSFILIYIFCHSYFILLF